jgi:hypothetical protein
MEGSNKSSGTPASGPKKPRTLSPINRAIKTAYDDPKWNAAILIAVGAVVGMAVYMRYIHRSSK